MQKDMSIRLLLFVFVVSVYSFFVFKNAKPMNVQGPSALVSEGSTNQSSVAPTANN